MPTRASTRTGAVRICLCSSHRGCNAASRTYIRLTPTRGGVVLFRAVVTGKAGAIATSLVGLAFPPDRRRDWDRIAI
jgi:hypothetical protein